MCIPRGGVSQELLDSQVRAVPATTQAPESSFAKRLKLLSEEAQKKLGISILIEHEYAPEVISKIHRFRAVDDTTLLELAKDIARVTADCLNAKKMQTKVAPPRAKSGAL